MKQTIYIATGNKAKLVNFQHFFSWIDPEITIELVPEYIEVEELGKTLAENSLLKVAPYKGKYKYMVIANNSGLFFDKSIVEIQDPVQVKRNALGGISETELSQEEIAKKIFDFYREVARKHGGEIHCSMKDVFTALLPDGRVRQQETKRDYQLIDRDTSGYDIYHH